jgi:hypothetical protein
VRRCARALYTAAGAPRGAGWPARIDPEPRDSHVRGSAARTSERVCCSAFAEVRPVKLSFGQQRAICLTSAQVLTVIIASIHEHWPIAKACTERVTVVTVTIIITMGMDRAGLYNRLIIKSQCVRQVHSPSCSCARHDF